VLDIGQGEHEAADDEEQLHAVVGGVARSNEEGLRDHVVPVHWLFHRAQALRGDEIDGGEMVKKHSPNGDTAEAVHLRDKTPRSGYPLNGAIRRCMAAYPFAQIEPKWQAHWLSHKTFRTPDQPDVTKPKFYALDMFPYPSGAGLHVGHPEGYTATDIVCRYKRMKGFNVLHPMGWDSFGLPAEQYAIETGTHPRETTYRNIDRFRQQLQAIGFSYDWEREIATTDRGLLPLDAVDFPEALRARARLSGRGAGELVPRAGHGAGQRGGH
jgi:hypothetical protein